MGPSCQKQETLLAMIGEGMDGMRLNLSHTSLKESRERIGNYQAACREAGTEPEILIDMHGPEMRTGWRKQRAVLAEGEPVILKAKRSREEYEIINVPPAILRAAEPGDHLLIHDGLVEIEVLEELEPARESCAMLAEEMEPQEEPEPGVVPWEGAESGTGTQEGMEPEGNRAEDAAGSGEILEDAAGPGETSEAGTGSCEVLEDGAKYRRFLCKTIRPGAVGNLKSVKIVGKEVYGDVLTGSDLENLDLAGEMGVTAVMQPFVRDGADLLAVREALACRNLDLKIFAKIETLQGVEKLDTILPQADVIVIARGDLGNCMPLWELPQVQKTIAEKCRKAGKPFMVVTQMLDSMIDRPVPTRAEVLDIFNAVLDGADYVMLTGETTVGRHPVEAVRYLARTAWEGEKYLERIGRC